MWRILLATRAFFLGFISHGESGEWLADALPISVYVPPTVRANSYTFRAVEDSAVRGRQTLLACGLGGVSWAKDHHLCVSAPSETTDITRVFLLPQKPHSCGFIIVSLLDVPMIKIWR
jgi:hypothetical protein